MKPSGIADEESASTYVRLELAARMDRLPVRWPHIAWISILAINLALQYYDDALFAYVMPSIAEHTGMSVGQLGVVTSMFFVGMVVGALIGGRLADRFGRRPVIVWGTLLYGVGAVATALASTFEVMLVARFVTGVGVQAATSMVLVYVAEMFPTKTRGRFVSVLTLGFVVVAPLIALLALVAIPGGGPNTWRHLFLIGGVAVLIAPIARFVLPESVRWDSWRGSIERAERTVGKLERHAEATKGPLEEPVVVVEAAEEQRFSLFELLRNKYMRRVIIVMTVGLFGANLAYFLFGNWGLYALIEGLHYDEEKAYWIQLTWNIAYCATPVVSLLLMDRMERKTLILWSSVASSLPLVILGLSTSSWLVTIAGGLAAVTTGLVMNVYFAYIPEAMPGSARGFTSGIVIGLSQLGGAASGVMGAALYGNWGFGGVMISAGVIFVVFALIVLVFGPKTTQRSLEVVNVEELGGVH